MQKTIRFKVMCVFAAVMMFFGVMNTPMTAYAATIPTVNKQCGFYTTNGGVSAVVCSLDVYGNQTGYGPYPMTCGTITVYPKKGTYLTTIESSWSTKNFQLWFHSSASEYQYVVKSGKLVKGWVKDASGHWYYFGKTENNTCPITGTTYRILDAKNKASLTTRHALKESKTVANEYASRYGWIKVSGKWYYITYGEGRLQNCSQKIGGKVYKFNSNGVCTNKT